MMIPRRNILPAEPQSRRAAEPQSRRAAEREGVDSLFGAACELLLGRCLALWKWTSFGARPSGVLCSLLLFGLVSENWATSTDRPTLYFTGLYGVSSGMLNFQRSRTEFLHKARISLEKSSLMKEFPFEILFSTDAENVKKNLRDPLCLSLVVTRDDEQIREYSTDCCGRFRRSDLNLGVNVVIYQKISSEMRNVVISSFPVNKYLTVLDTLSQTGGEDTKYRVMRLLDSSLSSVIAHLRTLDVEKIHARVDDFEGMAVLNVGRKEGVRVGQSVNVVCGDTMSTFMVSEVGEGRTVLNGFPFKYQDVSCRAELYHLKMYDADVWQVSNSEVLSEAAKKMFRVSALSAQISQWSTDALVGKGLCVLPSFNGESWVRNSDQTLSMLLSGDGGDEEFRYPKPTKLLSVNLTGVARGVVDENDINKQVAYKVWISRSVNGAENIEKDFVAAVNVIKGMEVIRDEDQYMDLIHAGILRLFAEGE